MLKVHFTPNKVIPRGRTAFVITALGVCVSAAVLYAIKQRGTRTQDPTIQKEVKYVFFSADGKPITLSQQEVYSIRQMHEDGIQPSTISERFGLETVMVMRIINCVKSM